MTPLFRMQKLLLTLGCVALAQAAVPAPRINCQECIDEMHSLSWIVKNSANDIEVTFNPRPLHCHCLYLYPPVRSS